MDNLNTILKEHIKTLKSNDVIRYDADIVRDTGVNKGVLSSYLSGKLIPSKAFMKKFEDRYKLSFNLSQHQKAEIVNRQLIPFYDGITIGGMQQTASMEGISQPSEWIDAGDWFRDATGAMRHYGDSMKEYESGCILVFKELLNIDLIIWGRNYVIETPEYRITKKVAKGKAGFIVAHSTNSETYPDGSLIHQPIDINLKNAKLHLVIGKVEKEGSSTPVKIKS